MLVYRYCKCIIGTSRRLTSADGSPLRARGEPACARLASPCRLPARPCCSPRRRAPPARALGLRPSSPPPRSAPPVAPTAPPLTAGLAAAGLRLPRLRAVLLGRGASAQRRAMPAVSPSMALLASALLGLLLVPPARGVKMADKQAYIDCKASTTCTDLCAAIARAPVSAPSASCRAPFPGCHLAASAGLNSPAPPRGTSPRVPASAPGVPPRACSTSSSRRPHACCRTLASSGLTGAIPSTIAADLSALTYLCAPLRRALALPAHPLAPAHLLPLCPILRAHALQGHHEQPTEWRYPERARAADNVFKRDASALTLNICPAQLPRALQSTRG